MTYLEQLSRSLTVFTKTWSYLKASHDPLQEMNFLKRKWAEEILDHLNIIMTIRGEVATHTPLLLIGNHISYLDITLLLRTVPGISFVSKTEISKWPVVGPTARKIDTIFVERGNQSSRQSARKEILKAFLEEKKRVVVFPSGTTCMFENKDWRKGIFEIAFESQVTVQPFRISYSPLRPVAYIDDDSFFFHLMKLSSLEKIQAEIEFHPPVKISDPTLDRIHWKRWAQGLI